jgi:MFS family permease
MNCNTQKGLYFIIIGSIITMICSIITSISSFFTKDTAVSMITSIFGIVSFIGVILILIGAILFFMGRKEFGEKHHKNIKNVVIIFVIAFIAVVLVIAVFIAIIIFSAITTISSTNSNTSLTAPTSLLVMVVSIIGAVLGGLIYYFALLELEDKTGKIILYAGIVSSIAISIVTAFYLAGMLSELFSSISTSSSNFSALPFTQNIGKIGILGIIPNLLYLCSFYIPYKRIKNGELVPVASSVGQESFPSRICPNCGRSISFDANFCPYCSKKI